MNTSAEPPVRDAAEEMRAWLQADLVPAMKARQTEKVVLLRTLIGAIDNAQSVTTDDATTASTGGVIAGAQAGVGVTEVPRRVLSAGDVKALLQAQVDERVRAAGDYAALGQDAAAERLRREMEMLQGYVERWAARSG